MKKSWIILGLCFTFVGCSISVNEADWDDDWDDDTTLEERAQDTCDAYCLELIECGALSDGSFAACRSHCVERYEDDEDAVSRACACVIEAECDAEEANECQDAPLPSVFPDEDADSEADDNPPGNGGSAAETGSCSVDHECGPGEDCISGECKARCVASCQCGEGDACVDGYCEEPTAPVVTCDSDCDCTSGESCMSGTCE